MKKKLFISAAAIITLPALCFASEAPDVDTIKVVDNPNQVVITQDDNTVLLHVDGSATDKDYRYECRVTPTSHPHGLNVMDREGSGVEFCHPFKRCCDDSTRTKHHMQVFASDIYFGIGSYHGGDASGAFKKAFPEVGILNFLALGYEFNKNRSRLSLGLGFNWSWYSLHDPYYWNRSNAGVLGYEMDASTHDGHNATLRLMSMQFPLMFNQSLGKRWSLAVGAILNWNYYAEFKNSYRQAKSNYSVTTHGLYQRKLSFDYIAMVSWHGLGAYFRYAPQSLFKPGFGPKIDNRWSIGLVLRGL